MRVLPMFVCVKVQFVDPVKDLLLGSGPCSVARFRHGGGLIVKLKFEIMLRLGKRW